MTKFGAGLVQKKPQPKEGKVEQNNSPQAQPQKYDCGQAIQSRTTGRTHVIKTGPLCGGLVYKESSAAGLQKKGG